MNSLIKAIRHACGLSQEEFARILGSTFATVNRWENGRNRPNKMAQERILAYCAEKSIPLFDIVMKHIRAQADEVQVGQDRLVLYHGSKAGISGEIGPISRERCDFGKGFYMGTDMLQPLTLICDFDKAKFYVVSISLRDLAILDVPADLEWAMLVAFHRGRMDHIKQSALYRKYSQLASGKDIVVGSIADDRMFFVLDNFFEGNITDKALVQSLAALQLGKQYVAITEKACREVRIEKEIELSFLEKRVLQIESENNRVLGISLANDICRTYRREGLFFDEIVGEEAGS